MKKNGGIIAKILLFFKNKLQYLSTLQIQQYFYFFITLRDGIFYRKRQRSLKI